MRQKESIESQNDPLLGDIDEIFDNFEIEVEEVAQRYNFSFKPSVREHLRELSRYYGKSTDSGFMTEVIEQLYEKMKIDEDVDTDESHF